MEAVKGSVGATTKPSNRWRFSTQTQKSCQKTSRSIGRCWSPIRRSLLKPHKFSARAVIIQTKNRNMSSHQHSKKSSKDILLRLSNKTISLEGHGSISTASFQAIHISHTSTPKTLTSASSSCSTTQKAKSAKSTSTTKYLSESDSSELQGNAAACAR